MKISTKGRYALDLMIDLAQNQHTGNISLKDVSKRKNVSLKYLEQIASVLTKNGFIKSVRGAQGGYSLTKDAAQYTAKDIICLVEGPIACIPCLEPTASCPKYNDCAVIGFYEGLDKVISDYLESYTLEDLMNMKKEYNFDFVI